LHVLDVGSGIFHEPLPLTQIGAQRRDLSIRAEATAQQTVRMELAQPSGIAHICFAPRHVLGVTRIDQNDLEPVLLKNLVGRDPIDPRRFHRHTGHAACFEPVRQIVQIPCKCAKRTHRRLSAGRVDRSHVHF
jgi:hypothetical protein